MPTPPSVGLYSKANREDAYKALVRRERERFQRPPSPSLQVWPEDLEFLYMEIWGGRCAATRSGAGAGTPQLVFTRWDRTKPASVGNLVLLAKPEAEAHDAAEAPYARYSERFVAAVERTLERAARERAAWAQAA